MKCILFVSDAGSIHTRRWAEYFRDQGVAVHVASFRAADIAGVQVHVMNTHGLGRLAYVLAVPFLRRLATRVRPDVVHAQYVTSYGFVAALAGLRPLVLTAWGTDVLISPKQSRLMRWIATYAVRHADAVTSVAQHMNASVAALGVDEQRVVAVPFGVDTQKFVPGPPAAPRHTGLRIVCTRNFGPIYNVDCFVAALALLRERGVECSADLVGDGPLRGSLEAQVAHSGLNGAVTFHGHVDHARLAELLAGSDVFVTPALSDGNNVSLNEAMASGTFPIGTDIPANAQWIEDGVNGLLYPPGDAARLADCMARAAADPAWRMRARAANREIVERRADWRVCVRRMEAVYAAAMQTRRNPS